MLLGTQVLIVGDEGTNLEGEQKKKNPAVFK